MDWRDLKRNIFDRLTVSDIEGFISELNPKRHSSYLSIDCPGFCPRRTGFALLRDRVPYQSIK